jgi:hypothetical protein
MGEAAAYCAIGEATEDWRAARDDLAAEGRLVAYFGYGSLVNRATLRTVIVGATPARVHGWRRLWQPRPDLTLDPDRAVHASLLTVEKAPSHWIDGLLVYDSVDNLPAVDLRENDYQRRVVALDQLDLPVDTVPAGCPVYIYEADPHVDDDPGPFPILQSYLDAVLQGFHREHGEAGVRRFIEGTGRFDTPILADRAWPIYPRAVMLRPEEAAFYDGLLTGIGATYLDV